jgi:hypothetical protein
MKIWFYATAIVLGLLLIGLVACADKSHSVSEDEDDDSEEDDDSYDDDSTAMDDDTSPIVISAVDPTAEARDRNS